MMNQDIRSRAAVVLAEVMETNIAADDNPNRNELHNWDSLKHLELILLLEEEFQIRFSAEQVSRVESLNDIVSILGENR